MGEKERGDWQEFSEEGEGGRLWGPYAFRKTQTTGKKKAPQHASTSTTSTVRTSGSVKGMLTGK